VGLGEGIGVEVGGSAASDFSASATAGARSANSLTPDVPQPNIAPSKKIKSTKNNKFLTTLYLFFNRWKLLGIDHRAEVSSKNKASTA
jgi:hypothetical protein